MATSEGIPSSIDIEFLELNDNPYFKICKVYFWLMAPQCIEDSWAQINLYMLFNQHDFTATLCISLTSLDYF